MSRSAASSASGLRRDIANPFSQNDLHPVFCHLETRFFDAPALGRIFDQNGVRVVDVDEDAAPCNTGQRGKRPVDRKSTRLNSSHRCISYAVFCLKKKIHTTYHS